MAATSCDDPPQPRGVVVSREAGRALPCDDTSPLRMVGGVQARAAIQTLELPARQALPRDVPDVPSDDQCDVFQTRQSRRDPQHVL